MIEWPKNKHCMTDYFVLMNGTDAVASTVLGIVSVITHNENVIGRNNNFVHVTLWVRFFYVRFGELIAV